MAEAEHKSRRYYTRNFWHIDDVVRRSVREDEANELVIEVRRGPYVNAMKFKWPEEQMRSYELERMLQTMFDAGVVSAKTELRTWLGA